MELELKTEDNYLINDIRKKNGYIYKISKYGGISKIRLWWERENDHLYSNDEQKVFAIEKNMIDQLIKWNILSSTENKTLLNNVIKTYGTYLCVVCGSSMHKSNGGLCRDCDPGKSLTFRY